MENSTSKAHSTDAEKKIEAIIRTVAAKHGIALGRNDPILVLHSLNELLINDFARKQEDLIHQFRLNLEEAADYFNKNMDSKSAEILGEIRNSHSRLTNDLLEKQVSVVAMSIDDKFNDLTEPHQRKIYQHIKSLNGQLNLMRRWVYLNITSSIMMLAIGVSIIIILTFN